MGNEITVIKQALKNKKAAKNKIAKTFLDYLKEAKKRETDSAYFRK